MNEAKPGLFALQLLIDAKRDEIINIFSEGNPREKSDAEDIMKELDPAQCFRIFKNHTKLDSIRFFTFAPIVT